jgi:four helix bundle protein
MSYKKLEIWQEARELSVLIHEMTFKLPKFEQFEEAQQIRRSSKSVRSNIVEGYGRRKYKADFIRFLIIAQASNDETIDHLETLFETKSLTDQLLFDNLHQGAVERDHNSNQVNEPEAEYYNQSSSIEYQESSNNYPEA